MPQAVDEAGTIWEVDAQGNPIRPVGRQARPTTVAPNPALVEKQRLAEARAAAAESRAIADQARQEEAANIKRMEFAASHGPGGQPLNQVPAATINAVTANVQSLRDVDNAIRLLERRPNSVGFGTGMVPIIGSNLTDWRDPQGTDVRASVAKVGAIQFHDISGAAINASEAPRLKPYIPQATDNPDAALKKLYLLRKAMADETNSQVQAFSPANGYYQLQLPQQDAAILQSPPPTERKAPEGGVGSGAGGLGEDPRYSGKTFNDNGEPDPKGEYDAYGRFLPNRQFSQTVGENGNIVNSESVVAFADPNAIAAAEAGRDIWYDKNGRGRRLNGDIIQGWLGPSTPPQDGEDPYQRDLKAELKRNGQADPLSGTNLWKRYAPFSAFQDETAGGISAALALLKGDPNWTPAQAYQWTRDVERARQEQNDAGQGTGGEALGFLGSATGGSFFPGGPGISGAMKSGAMLGAVEGFGRGNGAAGSAMNAVGGALGGTLGGGVGGSLGKYAIAPAVRRIANTAIGKSVTSRLGLQAVPNPTPIESEFARTNADLGKVRGAIAEAEQLGLPYALPDADPRLQVLAGQVARSSPEASTIASNYLKPRGLGQVDRLKTSIEQHLAPLTDIGARGKSLLDAGNIASAPYYEMARGAAAPVDENLSAMLRTPSGQDALRRAQGILQDRGIDPNGKRIFFDKEGLLSVEKKPSFETLDYVKRGFDSRLNEARNPVTGNLDLQGNPQLQAVNDLRARMVSKLDELNPNYPKARAEYAKFAQRKEALDTGYNLPKMLPRDAETYAARLTPDTMPEAQRGFATALADQAEKLRYTRNPFEAVYGSPAQQARIASMFPSGTDAFRRIYGHENNMAGTLQEVLGGSQTAMRQGMDGAFMDNLATPMEVGGSALGAPTAGTILAKTGSLLARKGREKIKQQAADRLAPVLFANTKDIGALSLLDEMIASGAKRTQAANKAIRRAGLFGATMIPATTFGN